MTPEQITALTTPPGQAALTAAAATDPDDPLAAAAALRRAGIDPELAGAALTQHRLRLRAAARFGADADRMYFTAAGLEQATRPVVADRRAARLADAGVRRLLDLGCGVGADTVAAARAGIQVTAVDSDPATATAAAANVAALGLAGRVTVHRADVGAAEVTAALADTDAVFCDPSRRHADTGRRVFDPERFSPPWSVVSALPARVPRAVLKLAPGLSHDLLPAAAEAEWVSVDGSLVELTLWYGPLAGVPRRATVLAPDGTPRAALTGAGDAAAPVGPVRRCLYDPDPAVVRSHLVAELAEEIGGALADPAIAYLYTDRPVDTAAARRLEVVERLPFSVKRLRAVLRAAGVGRVEIRKRGSAVDPDQLRRDLRLRGDATATVVLTRVAGAPTVLLCRPSSGSVPPPSPG